MNKTKYINNLHKDFLNRRDCVQGKPLSTTFHFYTKMHAFVTTGCISFLF